jgi:hypothetical protein
MPTIKEFMQKLAEAILDQEIPEDAELDLADVGDASDGVEIFYDERANTVRLSGS